MNTRSPRFVVWPSVITAFFVLASCGSPALAHHPGGFGNAGDAGPINTISASTLEQGRSVAGITIDYQSLKTLSDATLIGAATAGVEDVHSLDSIQSYALSYSNGLTNNLTVTVRLPFVRRTNILEAEEEDGNEFEVEDHGSTTGIGDLSVIGQYRFLNDRSRGLEAAVLAGVKTPTGPTDRTSPEGELQDAEFQPGSGSWDGIFGIAITQRQGPWSFDGSLLYIIVTEGTQNTDLGDLLFYNLAVSYRLGELGGPGSTQNHGHRGEAGYDHAHAAGPAVDLILEVNGEWQEKEEEASGVTDDNTGGNIVFISQGLRLANNNWSSFVSVGIPIVMNLNGIQSDPEWRITAGTALAF